MAAEGWKRLVGDIRQLQKPGRFPIPAYSEFMPPPRLGLKPYGNVDPLVFDENDPWGWPVSEFEEKFELQAGMRHLAGQILHALVHLGRGTAAHGISRNKLANNPYWPRALASAAGQLDHERYVLLLPMALSRTQDDKGRIRWTLFGASEQGPSRAFWMSFGRGGEKAGAEAEALAFFAGMLANVYGQRVRTLDDLRAAGFRIVPDLPAGDTPWVPTPLPDWTKPLVLGRKEDRDRVRYVLSFRPFGDLPAGVRQAYLAGRLHLVPFPGSLIFWGVETYRSLEGELPLASQVPLLHVVARHGEPLGIRVPQSGWMHEPRPDKPEPAPAVGPIRNTYRRTHRWQRVHRDENNFALPGHEDKLAHVLFSTDPHDLGLYGKPMARNVQLWTHDFRMLLDGPRARRADLERALDALEAGGTFGYRFQFPPMQIGLHAVYWHRPLAAHWNAKSLAADLLPDAPLGYLTGYPLRRSKTARPVELWPRLLKRPAYLAAIELSNATNHAPSVPAAQNPAAPHFHRPHLATRNARMLLDACRRWKGPLEPTFARRILTLPKHEKLEDWLATFEQPSAGVKAPDLASALRACVAPSTPAKARPASLTFQRNSTRSFEVDYWNTIALLSTGKYVNKDNADCVRDPVTQAELVHRQRDLEALGDYLLDYYRGLVKEYGLSRKALVGDLPFKWKTDFDFSWSDGWLRNRRAQTEERDLLVVIPGRDRSRAVIMADHYDTAYMENVYEKEKGGTGARLAAAGADDNHSATAALMLGARSFLELSAAGKLDCDVWLVHLTGEEFPSDCLGARHLCQCLVERDLQIRMAGGRLRDLSAVRIQGVYVLDMVAHNNDRDRDVFQIAPGTTRESLWLAYQAHRAAEVWNQSAVRWNERPQRKGRGRGRRSADGATLPAIAEHPQLAGEVRLPENPRSTLYNTDGQIFSDVGVPVVLFMENYDINRQGYHDTHDTLANIDLDYGAAVAAIAIESVARAATESPPSGSD